MTAINSTAMSGRVRRLVRASIFAATVALAGSAVAHTAIANADQPGPTCDQLSQCETTPPETPAAMPPDTPAAMPPDTPAEPPSSRSSTYNPNQYGYHYDAGTGQFGFGYNPAA
jgi:hypothetical protein